MVDQVKMKKVMASINPNMKRANQKVTKVGRMGDTEITMPNYSGMQKKLDDGVITAGAGAVEGTAVLSTGEGGGTKFLREDGDGTSSWQLTAGSGDNLGNHIATQTISGIDISASNISGTTISGVNVTSGLNPGHTHTEVALTTIPVFNDTGSTLLKGKAVYITGWNAGIGAMNVELADADDPSKMPSVGLIEGNITAGNTGFVINAGNLTAIDTTAFSVLDELWVDPTTPGDLTATKPVGLTCAIQKVAQVARDNAAGVLIVFGAGRSNDVPNVINVPGTVSGTNIAAISGVTVNNTADIANISGIQVGISGTTIQNTSDISILSGVTVQNTSDIASISGIQVSTSGTIVAHLADSTDPHGALLEQTNLSGVAISGTSLAPLGDHTTSAVALSVGTIMASDSNPPTASNYPQGTIFIEYTA